MTSIEKDLIAATKLQRSDFKTEQAFLKKVARAVNEMPDDDYDDLLEDSQEWANAAIMAIKSKEKLEPLGDGAEVQEEESSEEEEPESGTEDDLEDDPEDDEDDGSKDEPADELEDDDDEEVSLDDDDDEGTAGELEDEEEPSQDAERPQDQHLLFRAIAIQHPDLPRTELYKLAEDEGIDLKQNSMSTVIYHTDQTITCLREKGIKGLPGLRPSLTQWRAGLKAKETAERPKKVAKRKAESKKRVARKKRAAKKGGK